MMFFATARDFHTVQKKVAELIKGRILVGHALRNDLKVLVFTFGCLRNFIYIEILLIGQVLLLSHPKMDMRDTSECELFLKYYSFNHFLINMLFWLYSAFPLVYPFKAYPP